MVVLSWWRFSRSLSFDVNFILHLRDRSFASIKWGLRTFLHLKLHSLILIWLRGTGYSEAHWILNKICRPLCNESGVTWTSISWLFTRWMTQWRTWSSFALVKFKTGNILIGWAKLVSFYNALARLILLVWFLLQLWMAVRGFVRKMSIGLLLAELWLHSMQLPGLLSQNHLI